MPFFGSIIFEVVGAFAKWLFFLGLNTLKGRKCRTFGEIWNSGNRNDFQGTVENAWSNIALGMVIVVLTCSIIIWLGI